MKILFCCGNQNDPLAKSLAKKHTVTICTPERSSKNIPEILKGIPKPDFIFVLEQQPLFIPQDLNRITIPKTVYLVDLHLHFDTWHKHFAKLFDIVFCAQKKYVERFKKEGARNVFWLPLYSDPEVDKNLGLKRIYDFGFVGTLNPIHNFKRSLMLWLLKRKFKVKVGQNVSGKKRGKIYNQSKLAINISIANDLNFRTFESMASGSMLITDLQDGLTTFFKDKKHLIVYKNFSSAVKLGSFYLRNNKQRQKIAQSGQKEVLLKHTSDQRAEEIIKILRLGIKAKTKHNNKNDYYIVGRTYFFLYKRNEAITYLKKFLSIKRGISIQRIEALIFLLIAKYIPPKLFRIFIIFFRITYKILD